MSITFNFPLQSSRVLTAYRREQLREINEQFVAYSPTQAKSKQEKLIEKKHKHAVENIRRTVEIVQTFEQRLGIERWTKGSMEWNEHETLFSRRRYQRCLDDLERLVVSRMFELTKMNMSGTGSLQSSFQRRAINLDMHRLQDAKAHCQGHSDSIPSHTICS